MFSGVLQCNYDEGEQHLNKIKRKEENKMTNYNYYDANKNAIYTNYGYNNCGSYVKDGLTRENKKTSDMISYMEKMAKYRNL